MNITKNFPINELILELTKKKGSEITFEELKNEILSKDDEGKPLYYINIKENNDLAILYYNDPSDITSNKNKSSLSQDIEQNCRSYIIDKLTLKPIGSQFNKIIYNSDAKAYLEMVDWTKVVVQQCYEGTMLLVYNHNDKWYVSTRRCLNSEESTWIKNKSYRDMFDESIEGKFNLDNLNKEYCYHFVLVHYKNKNIVNYSYLGNEYKEIYHIMTTEKYTLKEVDENINAIKKVETIKFNNLEEVLTNLNEISNINKKSNLITTEGFVLKVYDGEIFKSPFKILKLQTEIYQSIMKIKPNNSNINQSYLELYQKDKLSEFLPYFSKFNSDIIKRIHYAMKNMAKEILDLYHLTRQKKNSIVYANLTEQYKKILYGLHGLYINHRKQDFVNGKEELPDTKLSRSINVHDVYHFIKNLQPNELRQLFYERMKLLNDDNNKFINKYCIYTMTTSKLMFGNINN